MILKDTCEVHAADTQGQVLAISDYKALVFKLPAARQRTVSHVRCVVCIVPRPPKANTCKAMKRLDQYLISVLSSHHKIYPPPLSVELTLHSQQLSSCCNSLKDWGKLLTENLYWLPELSGCVYLLRIHSL